MRPREVKPQTGFSFWSEKPENRLHPITFRICRSDDLGIAREGYDLVGLSASSYSGSSKFSQQVKGSIANLLVESAKARHSWQAGRIKAVVAYEVHHTYNRILVDNTPLETIDGFS